jgi:hypothetical protein
MIKVGKIRFEDFMQLPFIENQQVIQAFSSNTPQEALTDAIRTPPIWLLSKLACSSEVCRSAVFLQHNPSMSLLNQHPKQLTNLLI